VINLLKWVNDMLYKEIAKSSQTVEYWAEIEGVKGLRDPYKKNKFVYKNKRLW